MPPVIWAWLADAPKEGAISPGKSRQIARAAWLVLKKLRKDLRLAPGPAARHGRELLLALWKDADKVAYMLGYEGKPQMLFTKYRATMTEAKAIAALRPYSSAG